MELFLGHQSSDWLARKALLLQRSNSEVLVLTSATLAESWSQPIADALMDCARRGVEVRVLLESGPAARGSRINDLAAAGVVVRQTPRKLSWALRAFPVRAELWVIDRQQALSVNQRTPARAHSARELHMECLMGVEAATGLGAYFDRRWESEASAMNYTVRHKTYAFRSGRRAELEFFGCLPHARRDVTLCLPGGRVSRAVASALHLALSHGLSVNIFTNADRDDAPAIRRLRRLAAAGASVKICGQRLSSEGAVVDGRYVYLGPLPSSWHRWAEASCPVFVMDNVSLGGDLLQALERQVSVEVGGVQPPRLAFR
jgi:phosphatidylserine/phosphatidylglycerophosphate/cardiolipin synthase-like enzyme